MKLQFSRLSRTPTRNRLEHTGYVFIVYDIIFAMAERKLPQQFIVSR